jgi:DNA-binding transcriptional ArsR family regulator
VVPDTLSMTFAALADPTRRAILARLTRGEATVTELAAPHSISLPAISRHLKVLVDAGLVVQGRAAQFRPCRLDPAPLRTVDEWIGTYRAFFDDRLDRLAEHLETLTGPPVSGRPVSEGPVSEGPVSEGPVSGRPVSEGPVSEGPMHRDEE